jgi:hypothetical protein
MAESKMYDKSDMTEVAAFAYALAGFAHNGYEEEGIDSQATADAVNEHLIEMVIRHDLEWRKIQTQASNIKDMLQKPIVIKSLTSKAETFLDLVSELQNDRSGVPVTDDGLLVELEKQLDEMQHRLSKIKQAHEARLASMDL